MTDIVLCYAVLCFISMIIYLCVQALSKPFPKLPMKVMNDFAPGGAVETIAKVCAGALKNRKFKRIDWASPANRKENNELVSRIRQELLRAGHMRKPKIFLHPSLKPESLSKLRNCISKMGGEMAQSEKENGITHIVHSDSADMEKDDAEHYLRTLEIRGYYAHVHWWFLPDSYNEWIPAVSAPSDVDPDQSPPLSRPWHVYERWILDSEKYNEWMNEGDYETEAAAEENKRLREKAAEAKAEGKSLEAIEEPHKKLTKKEKRIAAQEAEVAPGAVRVLGPGVIEREVLVVNKKAIEGVGDMVDLSYGYRQQWMGPHTRSKRKIEQIGTNEEPAVHTIPFAAKWFDMDKVHHIEIREFPEFETGLVQGKTLEQYKKIRNHIIAIFERDPLQEIVFLDVLKEFQTDSMVVLKVFNFLQRWGIINYFDLENTGFSPDPYQRFIFSPAGEDSIIRQKRICMQDGMLSLITGGRNSKAVVKPGLLSPHITHPTGDVLEWRKIFCSSYPWKDCTDDRYTHVKDQSINLCPAAFKEGRFPPGTCGKDFRRFVHGVDQSQKDSGKVWSLQENLLLLEAIEYYRSDWDAIAKHVGGKTKVDCLQHFLKLPIETSLIPRALDLIDNEPLLKLEGGMAVMRHAVKPLPFAGTPNHLISTLSVLMSLISGEVAGAAAKGALEYLLDTVQNSENPLEAPISDDQMDKATRAALETAAIRAKELAHQRTREMQELVISMSEVQLNRILAKLDYIYALEEAPKEEIEIVNARRHRALKRTEELQAASIESKSKIT